MTYNINNTFYHSRQVIIATGTETRDPGAEGLSGLARAFIYAGARSLLVSHWSVESTSAAELTTGMFDAMSADKSIGRSEALQMSMVDLMTDKERSYYSHPAFWAPFSLVGDGATLNQKNLKSLE